MTAEAKKRAVATYMDKRRIEEKLFERTTEAESWQRRVWNDGETWATVAAAVDPKFGPDHVKRVAKELGVVIVAAPPPPDLSERVQKLEEQIVMLMSILDEYLSNPVQVVKEYRDANRNVEAQGGQEPSGSDPVSGQHTDSPDDEVREQSGLPGGGQRRRGDGGQGATEGT